jgi:enamine deaminase RidA (YjgF/YER057c/UK114 family)
MRSSKRSKLRSIGKHLAFNSAPAPPTPLTSYRRGATRSILQLQPGAIPQTILGLLPGPTPLANASQAYAQGQLHALHLLLNFNPDQPRDDRGRFGSSTSTSTPPSDVHEVQSHELLDVHDERAEHVKSLGILGKLGAAGKWMKGKTKDLYDKLERRYGKGQAIAIMAAGQALGWGATGVGATMGVPIWLPGSSLWGAAPFAAIAEVYLQAKRGARLLTGNSANRHLSSQEIERLGGKLLAKVQRLAEQAQARFPTSNANPEGHNQYTYKGGKAPHHEAVRQALLTLKQGDQILPHVAKKAESAAKEAYKRSKDSDVAYDAAVEVIRQHIEEVDRQWKSKDIPTTQNANPDQPRDERGRFSAGHMGMLEALESGPVTRKALAGILGKDISKHILSTQGAGHTEFKEGKYHLTGSGRSVLEGKPSPQGPTTVEAAEAWLSRSVHTEGGLSESEQKAITRYKGSLYEDFNNHLRRGDPLSDQAKQHMAQFDQALSRSRTTEDCVVKRGMAFEGAHALILQAHTEGRLFEDKAYCSTTLNAEGTAEDFAKSKHPSEAVICEIHVPKGSRGLYVPGESESELALDRGTRFKVDHVTSDSRGILHCRLSAIQDPNRSPLTLNTTSTSSALTSRFIWSKGDVVLLSGQTGTSNANPDQPRDDHGRFTSVDIHDPKTGEVYWTGPRHEAESMLREQDEVEPGHGLALRPSIPQKSDREARDREREQRIQESLRQESLRTPYGLLPGHKDYVDPPETLYHATYAADAIRSEGFKSSDELGYQVLGGSSSHLVSFTTRENAEQYRQALEIAQRASRNELSADETVAAARQFGVPPTHTRSLLEQHGDNSFAVWQGISHASRGKFPLFMGGSWPSHIRTADKPDLVSVPSSSLGTIYYNPGEKEWRASPRG